MVSIRNSKASDQDEISAIVQVHRRKNHEEDESTLKNKIEAFPEGCFVADLDGVVGYTISFPYVIGKAFKNEADDLPIENPDCYYIHDLFVIPEFRKRGIGRMLAQKVLQFRWSVVCLVATDHSERFWHKFGFRGFTTVEYCGSESEYMLRLK